MSRRSKRRRTGESGYWKSITDAMAGLLLILLLILMLFMVRILTLDDKGTGEGDYELEPQIYDDDGWGAWGAGTGVDYEYGDDHGRYEYYSAGGGGGYHEEKKPEHEKDYDFVENEFDRSAVLVRAVDIDTQNIIPETGIVFRLYDKNGKVVTLSTYYPHRISFDDFETESTGSFYLPEKIRFGSYTISNLKAPKSYNLARDVEFIIEEAHDWDSPYILTVYFGPEMNNIYIREVDEDRSAVTINGFFDVYAAEDIITPDGTLRAREGELVDTIYADSRGYGRSKELYLGNYRIVQRTADDGYAVNPDTVVELLPRTENEPVHEIFCEKTRIAVRLSDELRSTLKLTGAVFTVTAPNGTQVGTLTTDADGYAELDGLRKNTVFTITQTAAAEGYILPADGIEFTVDETGRIEGHSRNVLELSNRIIRFTVDLRESFTGKPIDGLRADLLDSRGEKLLSLDFSGGELTAEGLPAGEYTLVTEDGKIEQKINIQDTAAVQNFTITVTTARVTASAIGLAAVLLLLIFVLIWFIRPGKKRTHE